MDQTTKLFLIVLLLYFIKIKIKDENKIEQVVKYIKYYNPL